MKARAELPTIAVDDLRVGLYIHLDLGWMSHPFALSHFKLSSPEDLVKVRALGLQRLRWNPALSDPLPEPPPNSRVTTRRRAAQAAGKSAVAERALDPAAAAAARARQAAEQAAEQAALRQCEQGLAAATQALSQVHAGVLQRPEQARAAVLALNQGLLDQVTGSQELCLRLLGESSGDRAVAHAMNVTVLALLLARRLGWGERELADLGIGALLHDIGKLELPERLRQRDEQFSTAEARFYEEHVVRGVAQVKRLGLSPGALLVVGLHHEMADRSGFPLKLAGDQIAGAARVVALVNWYDRLCNPSRPHLALTPHEAVSLIFAQLRPKFDPAILDAFMQMMGVYPLGTVVQLNDDRFAIVVAVNSTRPLKPKVQVYQPGAAEGVTVTVDLQSDAGLGIRRSLKPQLLHRAALEALAPRARPCYFFEPLPATAAVLESPARQEALA
jgi:putative nucleotidyltransferase with HDIG domain